jgi:transposase
MTPYDYISVDVSKHQLKVHASQHSFTTTHDASGWHRISTYAAKLSRPLIVCEASGGYERSLLEAMSQAGLPVRAINAARVRAFAASEGIKAKTDPLDAKVIFLFAQEKKLEPMALPSSQQQRLGDLLDRRGQLVELLAVEKNHLECADKDTLASAKRLIRALEREIEKFEALIVKLIAGDPTLQAQASALTAISGVGEVTAWSVLAYLHEITTVSRNKLVALAGLAPFNRDSGLFKGKRRICGGRAKLRRCLYMAAHTAATHNPVIKPYVAALRNRGKPYKCAIVAAMRKLLLHFQSILKKLTAIPLAS